MKFKIIATIIVLALLVVLTFLFAPTPQQVDENGNPVAPAENTQPAQ